jgi:hypothetical protein
VERRKGITIKKSFYSVDSLKKELRAFERCYAMTSKVFYDAYIADDVPERVNLFDRAVWADAYEEIRRLKKLAKSERRRPARRRPRALQPAG